jgi:hypothetical protein
MSEIIWTKEWSAADDGTIISGADLANIQSDISVGVAVDAASIKGIPVDAPLAADDGSVLFYDNGNLKFDYVPRATLLATTAPTVDIDGGAIDGTAIGANSAATGKFTSLQLPAGATIVEFSTDGTFEGDSDDAVPTEKAIKTYVGTQPTPGLSVQDSDAFTAVASVSITETIVSGDTYLLIVEGQAASATTNVGLRINSDATGNDYSSFKFGANNSGAISAVVNTTYFPLSHGSISGQFLFRIYITARNTDTQMYAECYSQTDNGTTIIGYEKISVNGNYRSATPTTLQIVDTDGNERLTGKYVLYKFNAA